MNSQQLVLVFFTAIIIAQSNSADPATDHRNKCLLDGLTMLVQCNVSKVDSFANADSYTAEECCLYRQYSDCVKAAVNGSPCKDVLKVEYNDQLDTILAKKCSTANCPSV